MPRPKASGLPQEETQRLRTTQLLDVAAEVFLEMGYEAASTAEIAARAHASKRVFYEQFGSKEELFLAVIDYRTLKIADKVSVLFEGDEPIRPMLLRVARELLGVLLSEEHVALLRLVYMQAASVSGGGAVSDGAGSGSWDCEAGGAHPEAGEARGSCCSGCFAGGAAFCRFAGGGPGASGGAWAGGAEVAERDGGAG